MPLDKEHKCIYKINADKELGVNVASVKIANTTRM